MGNNHTTELSNFHWVVAGMAYHEYKRMELLLYHLNMKKTILYHSLFTLS